MLLSLCCRRDEVHCELYVERDPQVQVPNNGPTAVTGEIATMYGLADKPQEARMMETFAKLCSEPRYGRLLKVYGWLEWWKWSRVELGLSVSGRLACASFICSGEEAVRWRNEAYLTQKVVLALAESGATQPPVYVPLST